MREILFRGKRVDNGEWVYGNYNNHSSEKSISFYKVFVGTPMTMYAVIPETVGQYTGITDKNGLTKIFEGDIVKVADEYIDYVIWANGCFCMARQIMFYEFTYQDSNRMEVIGNIHDNPELLEGE